MIKKLLLVTFILLNVKVSVAVSNSISFTANTPPTLSNFNIIDSQPNKIYFDSNESITGSTFTGFTVSGKTITGISINSGELTGHYFTVSTPFTFWDNNTIRYEGVKFGTETNLANGSVKLNDFTLSYIQNNIVEPSATVNRYVNTSASGGGNGQSEDTAWTIAEAFANASPGMIIWIKAGNYSNQNLTISNDGTSTSPIKFVGYKTSIGDITSNYWDYGITWNTSEMPTFTGNDSGVAFSLNGANYVFFRNIQFSNYAYGIRGVGATSLNTNLIFNRINHHSFTASFMYFETFQPSTNLHEWSNSNFKLIDCVGLNSNLENYLIRGDGINLLDNVKSYSDALTGSPYLLDYHISLSGDNNIIINSHCDNIGNLSDGYAHGIGIKGNNRGLIGTSDYNLIANCTANSQAEGFFLRSHNVNNNVIKDCVYTNTDAASITSNWRTGGVWLWGGVNNNIVERVTVNNATYGLAFFDNQEENNYRGDEIGEDNLIKNCTFNGNKWAIYIKADVSSASLYNNDIVNCVFNDYQYFLKRGSADVQNLNFINCSFTDQAINSAQLNDSGASLAGFNFTYSNFYNNYGNWFPSGTGNINVDPKFENASQGNFKLEPDSPLIDVGIDLEGINSDFEGNARPQGTSTDIGAFEKKNENINPINANAGADITICSGNSTTLTASGGATYNWSTGETTQSISVSPESTTTYSVTVSNGNDSDSDDVIVTVDELPSVNVGSDITICSGESIILTAQGNGNFVWNSGETTSSITVSPSTTTTYSVTASNSCNTSGVSDEIVITVNDIPDIDAGSNVTIEEGSSTILTAIGDGSFLWSTGETTSSITVSPEATTTYTVTATSEEDCSNDDNVTVTVEGSSQNNDDSVQVEANAGEDVEICENSVDVVLTASGGENYLWSTGEITASITVNPTVTTTYTVTVSNDSSIDTDAIVVFVDETCSGISNRSSTQEMNLYPNPTDGLLNIELSGFSNLLNIMIYSLNGSMIYSENIDDYSPDKILKRQIDVSKFGKGVYFVRLINNNNSKTKKVLVI